MSDENPQPEVGPNLVKFKKSIDDVEKVLIPFFDGTVHQIQDELDALEKAKIELVSLYAINSLYWIYLCTQGINPRENPVKDELGRIQKYMKKVKDITDRQKAAKLDKGAAKRFVRGALYDQKQVKSLKRKAEDEPSGSTR